MGRPKKYTERTLRKAVEAYFDSITREVGMTEKVDTGRKDSSGHKIFENVPVINKRGEQVKYTEYLVPPYRGRAVRVPGNPPQHLGGILRRKPPPGVFRHDYAHAGAHARVPGTAAADPQGREGHYLLLQNNYGYTERREVDFGPQASRALTASAVPMAEREALLRELFQEFSQEGAAPDGAGET